MCDDDANDDADYDEADWLTVGSAEQAECLKMDDDEPQRSVHIHHTVTTYTERERRQTVEPMRIDPRRRTVYNRSQTPLEHRYVKHLPADNRGLHTNSHNVFIIATLS